MPTEREMAVFEAAIKLGALYHQFVGTPVSPETADTIEAAIESAVRLQPYVTDVRVSLDRSVMLENPFGYSEVQGRMFDVTVSTKVGDATCTARLNYENGYPMMSIQD
ncbi:MAG: hypothetical protein D5R99_00485 [Methanocalculus sp. MSAO_Arc1]|uniref:dihydroneopterin aldolase family protein n=1 Tax=Methanocalculus TaxID=71151 RepID=UPI000FF03612|nr:MULTISPECIES: dihydroneopterin aldolase family protein [unclassified Methanocalculus]MCP1661853.1 hypothetical protein [Methanocalculus sp. AMF5]RQD81985.1 MAG: hypothetical protein D5R99_00485 [Methanocalculus sp. MSAO_Arc1]